jgi:cold shock CspA family protein
MQGTVVTFDLTKCYGFIDAGLGFHVFVHFKDVIGKKHLSRGNVVAFELRTDRHTHRCRAAEVRVLAEMRDPLTGYQISESRDGWLKARRDRTAIYGMNIEELRLRATTNERFFTLNAGPKSCDLVAEAA